MNREIKFRVWCKGTSPNENFDKSRYIKQNDFIFRKYFCHFPDLGDEENNFVIEQFTGLKDKSGKEIYEGDIVKIDLHLAYVVHVVKFEKGAFCVGQHPSTNLGNYCIPYYNIQVIGNIHENPELLKN